MKDKHTRTEIEEALYVINHPQQRHNALETAYDGAIERINNQTSNKRIWACRLLAWVFHARRLLTPEELIHALSVRIGDHGLNEKNFVSLPEIVSLCAGLVMIDEKSTVVQLVHYTTKEYLTIRSSTRSNGLLDWIRPQEEELARSCLIYLAFDTFEYSKDWTEIDGLDYCLRPRPTGWAFLKYASRHWGEHARFFQEKIVKEGHNFLRETRLTNIANRAMFEERPGVLRHYWNNPRWHGPHIASFFDLTMLFQPFIDEVL